MLEVFVRLPWKTDDDVARQCQPPARIPDALDSFEIVATFVATAHQLQNPIAARLYRKVNPVTEVRILFNCGNDVRMKITWERGSELDARQTSRSHRAQETAKRSRARESLETIFNARPVAVHVLADEMNFLVTKALKSLCFGDDLAGRSAAFTTARVRHDTERTKLVAAFDDGNESNVRRVTLDRRNIPRVVFSTLAEIENSSFSFARSFD